MTIGDRVKEARKAKGFTQLELGKRMGVTQATVNQYESGKRNPKMDTLKKIADALDIPVSQLMDDDMRASVYLKELNEKTSPFLAEHDEYETRLLAAFGRLPYDGYKQLVKVVEECDEDELWELVAYALHMKGKEPEAPTVRVYRAAKSESNTEGGVVEISRERLERIRNATEDDEL